MPSEPEVQTRYSAILEAKVLAGKIDGYLARHSAETPRSLQWFLVSARELLEKIYGEN